MQMKDECIRTNRLHIRRVIESDWPSLLEIWRDFSRSAYAQYDRPHSMDEESARKRVAKWAVHQGNEHMFFAVCLEQTIIGYAAFNIRENGYELGYCFHSDYHGKGFAKESLSALIAHLRGKGVAQLIAGTALANLPSIRLLHSLGFKQIGTEKVSFYRDAAGNAIEFDGGIFEMVFKSSFDTKGGCQA